MPENNYFLFWNLTLITILSSVNGINSTCRTTTAIEGWRSEIYCYFNENTTFTWTTFDVYKYDSVNTRELVLTCYWPRIKDDPECATRPGYHFDPIDLHTKFDSSVFQATATITIPRTSLSHAGTYSCQSSQNDLSTEFHNCTLNVIGTRNRCTAGRVTEGERSTIVCHFNQDLHDTKGSFAVRKMSPNGGLVTVIACIWGKQDDIHVCAGNTGYTLTSDITQSAAVSIHNTGPEHGGEYLCVTVPERRWVTSEHCRLEVVTAVAGHASITQTPSLGTSTLIFKFSSMPTKRLPSSNTGNPMRITAPFVLIATSFIFRRCAI